MRLIHMRVSSLSSGVRPTSGVGPKTSSRYWQIIVDSAITRPSSSSSAGTVPCPQRRLSTERLQQRLKAQAGGGEDVGSSAWRGARTCGFLATYSSERFSPAITLTTSFLRRAAAG